LFTALMTGATVWLALESRSGVKRQIGVQTWLALEARFDSKEMKRARAKLGKSVVHCKIEMPNEVSEDVLELFESIGTAYNLGMLNKDLALSSFGYHGAHWWDAVEGYIKSIRDKKHDRRLFCEFEMFAKKMRPHFPTTAAREFGIEEMALDVS
jgi:hypothetical protein